MVDEGKISALTTSERLVRSIPMLPFMGVSCWLAWAHLAYGAGVWMPTISTDGTVLSQMFIVSTLVFAAFLLVSARLNSTVEAFLDNKRCVLAGGVLASVGSLLIQVSVLVFVANDAPNGLMMALFYVGACLSGLGTAFVCLKFGKLFSGLPPRLVLLYMAAAHLVVSLIFFSVASSPAVIVFDGMPSIVGSAFFILLPVLGATLSVFPLSAGSVRRRSSGKTRIRAQEVDRPRAVSKSFSRKFAKLLLVVLVFTIVEVMSRSSFTNAVSPAVTLQSNNMVMLLNIVISLIFGFVAATVNSDKLNFAKMYSGVICLTGILIVAIPVVGGMSAEFNAVVSFLQNLFEFIVWCLLAFIVFQKKISPVIVFGYGYGTYMLGSAIGWLLGIVITPWVQATDMVIPFYLVLMGIMIFCTTLFFSIKDFDELFSLEDDEDTLEHLLSFELSMPSLPLRDGKQGRFTEALKVIAEESRLSVRESEVMRFLAMGRNGTYIAEQLGVSANTVRTHTRNVYTKLDVHSREELIDYVDQWIDSSKID